MTSILETQVTELLTSELGRAPTAAEIASGMVAPQTLSQIHNTLNATQSILSVSPGDDLQAAVDKLVSNGGGVLFLNPGTFTLSHDLVLDDNIRIQGVGSGGSIIDFDNGPYQLKVIGTALDTVQSVFLQGFTVQNSTTDLINVDYSDNFGGYDVTAINGLSGITINHSTNFNWDVFTIDSCGTGMIITNVDALTVQNAYIENSTSSGGIVWDSCSNAAFLNSSVAFVTGPGFSFTNVTNMSVGVFSVEESTGDGVVFDSCSNMDVSGGSVLTCGGNGITYTGADNIILNSTTISDSGGYGIAIDANSDDNLISSNFFAGNSSGAANDLGVSTLIRSNVGLSDN